jgi:carbon monoxide dehydrogenase subunit G
VTQFSASVRSGADISAPRAAVWNALTDPVLLPKLTPMLEHIEANRDTWRWTMVCISALGVSIAPTFTEQMSFAPPGRIAYSHRPPAGGRERAGAEGRYQLSEIAGGTHLHVELTLTVDLPLPKAAGPAVRKVMTSLMSRTGDRFAANLLAHLGARELPAAA